VTPRQEKVWFTPKNNQTYCEASQSPSEPDIYPSQHSWTSPTWSCASESQVGSPGRSLYFDSGAPPVVSRWQGGWGCRPAPSSPSRGSCTTTLTTLGRRVRSAPAVVSSRPSCVLAIPRSRREEGPLLVDNGKSNAITGLRRSACGSTNSALAEFPAAACAEPLPIPCRKVSSKSLIKTACADETAMSVSESRPVVANALFRTGTDVGLCRGDLPPICATSRMDMASLEMLEPLRGRDAEHSITTQNHRRRSDRYHVCGPRCRRCSTDPTADSPQWQAPFVQTGRDRSQVIARTPVSRQPPPAPVASPVPLSSSPAFPSPSSAFSSSPRSPAHSSHVSSWQLPAADHRAVVGSPCDSHYVEVKLRQIGVDTGLVREQPWEPVRNQGQHRKIVRREGVPQLGPGKGRCTGGSSSKGVVTLPRDIGIRLPPKP